jgi:hypothetical protein
MREEGGWVTQRFNAAIQELMHQLGSSPAGVIEHQRENCLWVAQRLSAAIQALILTGFSR